MSPQLFKDNTISEDYKIEFNLFQKMSVKSLKETFTWKTVKNIIEFLKELWYLLNKIYGN